MKELSEIIEICDKNDVTLDYQNNAYNPMQLFYDRTKEKEICHSTILADLLSPDGKHHCGDIFLKQFFMKIGLNYYSNGYYSITKERAVKRVRTELVSFWT